AGRVSCHSELIDHNKAIVSGPATGVPRQAFPYRHLTFTSPTVPKLPRNAGSGTVKKYLEEADPVSKWESSASAKKRAAAAKRRTPTDFGRFQVLVHKKGTAR
ncbi:ribosomal protein L14-domain-containing protein, partial [Lactarius sanguifluus]